MSATNDEAELRRQIDGLQHRVAQLEKALHEYQRSSEDALALKEAELHATLCGIGDAVISTDIEGRVARMNPLAEQLTGWTEVEAVGKPLGEICRVVNEETRELENPLARVLREGVTVGPADHTLLIPRDGKKIPVSDSAAPIFDPRGNIAGVVLVFCHRTEQRLTWRLAGTRLSFLDYAAWHTLDELLTRVLDEVGAFVDSPIGFYHFVEPDQKTVSLQQWSTRTLKEFCRAEGKGLHYSIDQAGVWVDCVYAKKPVIHNDYASLPHRKGMPQGHAEVIRELVVPVMRENKVVAILGVGNKPTEYTQEDAEIVSHLADVTWEIVRQKRAEENHRLHSLILSQITDRVIVTDLEGYVTSINEATCRMLGKPREQLIGQHVSILGDDASTGATQGEIIRKTLQEGAWRGEVTNFGADGSAVILDSRTYVVRDDTGQPIALCGISTDITERKRAEDSLREAVLRQKQVVKAANVGLWDRDLVTNKVRYSAEWKRQIGYEEHEISDDFEEWRSRVHPDDLEPTLQRIQRCIAEARQDYRAEFRFRHKDGSYRWILAQGSVLQDETGRPIRILGSQLDITDRKQAEEALRESKRQKELILNATSEMLAYYDTDLRVIWANRAAGESIRKSPEELVGLHCYELWAQRGTPCPDCPVLKARDAKAPSQGEMQTPDGRYWFQRGYPVLDEAGQVIALVEFTQEITERKRAEEEKVRLEQQFHQAQRLESIGRLAGGAAHDLNNLLTPILGYGEMLLAGADGNDPRREWLEQIVKAGKRAQGLVRQLLAFSRKQALESKHIDLNSLLRNSEKLLRHTIREDVAIHMVLAESVPLIKGDVGQLEQVVMNLALNAQDAMPDGGELTIETREIELDEGYAAEHEGVTPGPHVVLVVSDTGCGMDAETRGHLFEPFFTTKRKDKGTGLGLATVYGIVTQHGGNIWAYSEPGVGTTFSIYLPISTEFPGAEDRASSLPPVSDLRGSATILLVEDEEQVRNLALAILKQKGYTVLVAGSGKEALRILDQHDGPVHLLLTDVIMPEMNGKQLFERVSRAYPDVKVLYMSGYTDNVIARHGVMDAGIHFIQKPFSVGALAAKVRECWSANKKNQQ